MGDYLTRKKNLTWSFEHLPHFHNQWAQTGAPHYHWVQLSADAAEDDDGGDGGEADGDQTGEDCPYSWGQLLSVSGVEWSEMASSRHYSA